MTQRAIPGPSWIPVFLETLATTRKVAAATAAAERAPGSIYAQRRRNREFSDAWNDALCGRLSGTVASEKAASANGGWQKPFLELLAETSNIKGSAKKANVPLSTIYAKRARDRGFAAKWEAALYEGYVNLEMEVLGYLRDPEPGYKMDVANALRLLTAHKETAARQRARRGKRDKEAVLASLNAKIDRMRERKAAAEQLLAEDGVVRPVDNDRD